MLGAGVPVLSCHWASTASTRARVRVWREPRRCLVYIPAEHRGRCPATCAGEFPAEGCRRTGGRAWSRRLPASRTAEVLDHHSPPPPASSAPSPARTGWWAARCPPSAAPAPLRAPGSPRTPSPGSPARPPPAASAPSPRPRRTSRWAARTRGRWSWPGPTPAPTSSRTSPGRPGTRLRLPAPFSPLSSPPLSANSTGVGSPASPRHYGPLYPPSGKAAFLYTGRHIEDTTRPDPTTRDELRGFPPLPRQMLRSRAPVKLRVLSFTDGPRWTVGVGIVGVSPGGGGANQIKIQQNRG